MSRLALVASFLAIAPAAAGEIAWRTDYDQAVREAAETNRPLLLDFGTKACVYCRKLDATTFRDAEVVRLVGEKFIPVKVDAERERRLTQAMRVDSYPTLVAAGPDGKVVAVNAGYLDASSMRQFLQNALMKLPAKAKPPAENKPAASYDAAWSESHSSASALLNQARRDFQDGFYLTCLERCDRLGRDFPDAAEAPVAHKLAEQALAGAGDDVRAIVISIRRSGRN
jgi:thioredoxin-like negative regulator of GroEL